MTKIVALYFHNQTRTILRKFKLKKRESKEESKNERKELKRWQIVTPE
jgi:hypothetical protein